jgi:DNA-binding transcriptional ArsR family regulator
MVTYRTDTFKAIADPTRRAVLDYLLEAPHGVNELAGKFDISRPAISKHLRILLDARLVQARWEGRERIYEIDAAPLGEVDQWLQEYRTALRHSLRRLKAHIESNR